MVARNSAAVGSGVILAAVVKADQVAVAAAAVAVGLAVLVVTAKIGHTAKALAGVAVGHDLKVAVAADADETARNRIATATIATATPHVMAAVTVATLAAVALLAAERTIASTGMQRTTKRNQQIRPLQRLRLTQNRL